jgi:hypothetical protein
MRKLSTLFLFAVSVMVLFSCNKKEQTQTQPYAINGVDDIYVTQGEDDSWNLEVRSIGPLYDTVELSIGGLPQGLTASFSQTKGIPTYFSTVIFSNVNALPGSYPCVLTASSAQAGKSTYKFMIKISAPIICGLVGDFSSVSCAGDTFTSKIQTIAPPIEDSVNTVHINNLGNIGLDSIRADIDCDLGTITIPAQTFTENGNTVQISGNGSFNNNSIITITYNMVLNGGPQPVCTVTMTPKN